MILPVHEGPQSSDPEVRVPFNGGGREAAVKSFFPRTCSGSGDFTAAPLTQLRGRRSGAGAACGRPGFESRPCVP